MINFSILLEIYISQIISANLSPRGNQYWTLVAQRVRFLTSCPKRRTSLFTDLMFISKANPFIPSTRYDGYTLPFKDKQFNSTMAVDVLHHCENIKGILQEMIRVSHRIIIKDHYYKSGWDLFLLKLFDISANKPYGVNTIFNFKNGKNGSRFLRSSTWTIVMLIKKWTASN